MEIFEWKAGTQKTPAKVTIGSTTYDVADAQYEGETPLTPENLNQMQNVINGNISDAILGGTGSLKLLDGTLICYGASNTTASGYLTVDFPIAFTSKPVIVATPSTDAQSTNYISVKLNAITTSNFKVVAVYSGGYLANLVQWIAIGKWK